jgi:hypothetical protein
MAPKLAANPGRTSRYYRSNPEARKKRNAAQRKINRSKLKIAYRAELNAERRKRGIYGKGGPDMSHDSKGNLKPESPKRNRARNGHGDNKRYR